MSPHYHPTGATHARSFAPGAPSPLRARTSPTGAIQRTACRRVGGVGRGGGGWWIVQDRACHAWRPKTAVPALLRIQTRCVGQPPHPPRADPRDGQRTLPPFDPTAAFPYVMIALPQPPGTVPAHDLARVVPAWHVQRGQPHPPERGDARWRRLRLRHPTCPGMCGWGAQPLACCGGHRRTHVQRMTTCARRAGRSSRCGTSMVSVPRTGAAASASSTTRGSASMRRCCAARMRTSTPAHRAAANKGERAASRSAPPTTRQVAGMACCVTGRLVPQRGRSLDGTARLARWRCLPICAAARAPTTWSPNPTGTPSVGAATAAGSLRP
jgi:hypothetical protein